MKHVIGVDQGGSGTRAVVCTLDGQLLGVGLGPGACHAFVGMPAAMAATRTAVQAALDQAGVRWGSAEVILGGYTGADWPDEYQLLRDALRELHLGPVVEIVNDSIAALRGGTAQTYGAILVAGSGANCAVRAPDGREYIYHYYHDSGLQGGSAISRAALQAVFRAETGRPPQTTLRQVFLDWFKLPDVDALMRAVVEAQIPGDQLLKLVPLVFAAASWGDAAARKILIDFGHGCGELLTNGLHRLEMYDLDVEVVLSGGVFKALEPLLVNSLSETLRRSFPRTRLVHARYEPCVGAALLALEKMGKTLPSAIKVNLERTAQKLDLVRREN